MHEISFPSLGLEFNINSVAFRFFGGKPVYWYGIIIVTGIILAVLLAIKNGKKAGITADNICDYMLITLPLAVIGARLYYVAFSWDSYRDNPFDILKIWNGGLAIYGAIIVSVITMLVFCKAKNIKTLDFLDVGAVSLILGQAIGRWGNFTNAEAYGSETDSFLRMGIYEFGKYVEVHPTFLYESLWNITGFVILLVLFRKHKKFSGQIFWSYCTWYGLGRFFIEGLRTDSLYAGPFRVSQIVALITFAVGIVMIIRGFRDKKTDMPEITQ